MDGEHGGENEKSGGDCFHRLILRWQWVVSFGSYAESSELATLTIAGVIAVIHERPVVQLLKVRPTVGPLEEDGAVTDILSFGNDLASVSLIEAPCP